MIYKVVKKINYNDDKIVKSWLWQNFINLINGLNLVKIFKMVNNYG